MSGTKNIQAKQVKWQDPSKFRISLLGPGAVIMMTPEPDDLTLSCTGMQLPELAGETIEDWIGEQWRYAPGRIAAPTVSITFKDYDNFKLYRAFTHAMQVFTRMYPKDQEFSILIETADDFDINTLIPVAEVSGCLLTTVGGSTLENSATSSIAEVTITAKATHITLF